MARIARKIVNPAWKAPSATDAVAAIRFAMEQCGLTRRDLEPYIGSRARVAEVLNNKRSLILPMIRRLHNGLGIPAEALIRPAPVILRDP